MWDIEWDYDYGFVLTSGDGGKDFASHPSANGYTTSNTDPLAGNPNQNGCQATYDNGITGTSGSYDGRLGGDRPQARQDARHGVPRGLLRHLRPGRLGRPGAALQLRHRPRPGATGLVHRRRRRSPPRCPTARRGRSTRPTSRPAAPPTTRASSTAAAGRTARAPAARAGSTSLPAPRVPRTTPTTSRCATAPGFDLDGNGQIDRDPIAFASGFYTAYTDEAHGYGNAGTDDPPAQSPLDSQPEPGSNTPDLGDAAWTDAAGDSHFSDGGDGWTDNYADPSSASGNWEFDYDCLTFDVLGMSGNGDGTEAGEGPQAADGDLTGDVRFTLGDGCAPFDYGYGDEPTPPANTAPTATATATPGHRARPAPG